MATDPSSSAAQQIRSSHPYAFRSGEWADLLSVTRHAKGRECYAVRFSDGTSDFWPVDDSTAAYKFRTKDEIAARFHACPDKDLPCGPCERCREDDDV